MSETLVRVDGVSKKFCRSLKKSLWYGMQDLGREITGHRHGGNGELRPDEFWAVKDVSFELKRGECLGLVGHNGAGKTTLLKMLNGLVKPDAGKIEMRGRVGAIIALGAGFNPILTGRENIYVNGSVLGLAKNDIDRLFDDIVGFSGLEQFIDTPVQYYSSGMTVRLGFAIATSMRPDVLILDEVLAVGDSSFRDRCYSRIGELVSDCAVVLVTHEAASMHRLADWALLMHRGSCVEQGEVLKILSKYNEINATECRNAKIEHADEINSVEAVAWVKSERVHAGVRLVDIVIELRINSNCHIDVEVALGNIVSGGGAGLLAGQFEFLGSISCIKAGENMVRFLVPSVALSEDWYSCSIVIFSDGGKRFILSARDFFRFQIKSNNRFGVAYALGSVPCSGVL